MKKIVIAFLYLFLVINSYANLSFIDLKKAVNEKYVEDIAFLIDKEKFVDHWSPEWTYKESKEEIKKELQKIYSKIDNDKTADTNNIERELLLGDIAFFLYNLDVTEFDPIAEKHFKSAIELGKEDYRPYWYLAKHMALSLNTVEGIKVLDEAKNKKPIDELPAEFWDDYSSISYLAGMMSHTLMGMEYEKQILGEPGYFEQNLGEVVRKKLKPSNITSKIKAKSLWNFSEGICKSWQLGVQMKLDNDLKVGMGDYKNNSAVFTIVPPKEKGKNKSMVEYTIEVITLIPKPEESLESAVDKLLSKYTDTSKLEISTPFKSLSYEIKDKTTFTKQGGGHYILTAVERDEPEFPGLALESPAGLKKTGTFTFIDRPLRFKGKIFYLVILEAGEAIFENANKRYVDFLENKLILE